MMCSYDVILSRVRSFIDGVFFFFQAEDGIRDLVRSRGLGDVYKRQVLEHGELLAGELVVAAEDPVPALLRVLRLDQALSLIHI